MNGRGLNEVYNVLDINLMKKMGANSFRTSHYPYSEEMMLLCDREGIVVIDETPAVGLMLSFNFDVSALDKEDFTDDTWKLINTRESHEQVIRELIARDKTTLVSSCGRFQTNQQHILKVHTNTLHHYLT